MTPPHLTLEQVAHVLTGAANNANDYFKTKNKDINWLIIGDEGSQPFAFDAGELETTPSNNLILSLTAAYHQLLSKKTLAFTVRAFSGKAISVKLIEKHFGSQSSQDKEFIQSLYMGKRLDEIDPRVIEDSLTLCCSHAGGVHMASVIVTEKEGVRSFNNDPLTIDDLSLVTEKEGFLNDVLKAADMKLAYERFCVDVAQADPEHPEPNPEHFSIMMSQRNHEHTPALKIALTHQ